MNMGRNYKREILRHLSKKRACGVELQEQLSIEPEKITRTLRRMEAEGVVEWDEHLGWLRGVWKITEKGGKACR